MDPDTAKVLGRARMGNRRRLVVFALTLVTAMIIGLAWNFLRPAEYRAVTRLQISLPAADGPAAAASGAFATRLELISSRPLLEKLATALTGQIKEIPGSEGDPVSRLQAMLRVSSSAETDVVQVEAIGAEPGPLPHVLNALPDVLHTELAARQARAADDQLTAARQELARLERTASERQKRLEAYRQQAGVISERDENDSVARSKGLNQSLNSALEKEAAAAARLKAVEAALASGEAGSQVRGDTTLNGLLSRAHQAREDLKDMERAYTPEFMAMDPRARALRARLTELERQIAQQRTASLEAALQTAREEHASTQATVERLRAQLASARPALTTVSTRLAEAKSLEEDLQQVEKARREMLERVARLEANELRRVATVTVIEPAVAPTAPFRPDRALGAAYVTGAAFVLALLAVGTVELFNLAPASVAAAPATIVVAPGWEGSQPRLRQDAPHPLGLAEPSDGTGAAATALPAPLRVLEQPQAAALLAAAQGTARLACAAGLLGLSVAEATAVRRQDLDLDRCRLRVGGSWAREVPVPTWLAHDLAAGGANGAPLLHDAAGQPLPEDDLASMLVGAALDAGLPQADGLNAETLRHTCIDWLVGQGMRFSELAQWVGPVDAGLMSSFAQRHPGVPRVDSDAVDFLMPALVLAPQDATPTPRPQA